MLEPRDCSWNRDQGCPTVAVTDEGPGSECALLGECWNKTKSGKHPYFENQMKREALLALWLGPDFPIV